MRVVYKSKLIFFFSFERKAMKISKFGVHFLLNEYCLNMKISRTQANVMVFPDSETPNVVCCFHCLPVHFRDLNKPKNLKTLKLQKKPHSLLCFIKHSSRVFLLPIQLCLVTLKEHASFGSPFKVLNVFLRKIN